MLHLMKNEWIKVRLSVLAVTLPVTLLAVILSCTLYQNYALSYALDAWEIGISYFSMLFPLFTVVPLCWNLYYERRDNFLLYVLPRVTQRRYLSAKWMVHALCAFSITFIPHVLSAISALYINEATFYSRESFDHVFMETYVQMPFLYAILSSCWKGLLGVLIMTFGFVLSMYVNNIFIILTGPFVYSVLENFVLSILRFEQYRLVVSFSPGVISADAIGIGSFLAGPALLTVVILFTVFFLTKVKKAAVVKV